MEAKVHLINCARTMEINAQNNLIASHASVYSVDGRGPGAITHNMQNGRVFFPDQ